MLGTAIVTESKPKLGDFGFAGDDHVVPFEVGPLDVRGRAVQLGPLLDDLLGRHDYPEPVARLLAQGCTGLAIFGTTSETQMFSVAQRQRALEALVTELLPRVRNLVRYLVRGDDHVDDIAQQALLAILRGLPTFEGSGSFAAWCDRITARETFAYLRRDRAEAAKRRDAAPEMRLLKGGLAGEGELHDPYTDRRAAVQLLELLPEDQRSVLALHHIAGLSMQEIADMLRALSSDMMHLGAVMQYVGGFGKVAKLGTAMYIGASNLRTWAHEIEEAQG